MTAPPLRRVLPFTINPSGVSSISTPSFNNSVTRHLILSDSLFLKSPASLTTVLPSACEAKTAITGNSSINLGIISPSIVTAFNSEVFILISPTSSLDSRRLSKISISAPIWTRTSIIPVLVWLSPTFFKIMSEFGTIAAATIKNAADEISPHTERFFGSSVDFFIFVTFPSEIISAPRYLSILSV